MVLPIIIGLVSAWLAFNSLDRIPSLLRLEGTLADTLWLKLPAIKKSKKVVIILVKESTPKALGETQNLLYVPKKHIARLISALDHARARAIVFDMSLDLTNPPELLSAVNRLKTSKVAFVMKDVDNSAEPNESAPSGVTYEFVRPDLPESSQKVYFAHGLALTPEGMTTSSYPVLMDSKTKGLVPYFGFLAALLSEEIDPQEVELTSDGKLVCGNRAWETGGLGEVDVRWTKEANPFPTYEFSEAIKMVESGSTEAFEGRTILVGEGRLGRDEILTSPFRQMHGVLFGGHTVNTYLMPNWQVAKRLEAPLNFLLDFALALYASCCFVPGKKLLALIGPPATLSVSLGLPICFTSMNVIPESVPLVISTLLSIVFSGVVLALRSTKIDTRTAGSLGEAVVLFADIVGSTALTKTLGAQQFQEDYTKFINDSHITIEHAGGKIERTSGDGFLAVFQSGTGVENIRRAVASALDITKPGRFQVRVSLEFGVVSGGYVSESGRKVWSTTGNTVNLAARILACCDQFGKSVVIGPTAARMLDNSVPTAKLGTVKPKGLDEDVDVYGLADIEP